ncbi:hypothetical protein LTS18_011842, partial [Coniosporium uncinatum]
YGHQEKAYDFATYQSRVAEFCSQPWTQIVESVGQQKWGKKVDEGTVREVCFKASWLINVLHDGIGIPRVGVEGVKTGQTHNGTKEVLDSAKEKGFLNPFQAVNKIDGVEVSWTLGKIVLYAASQVPPPENEAVKAVGFGNNTRTLAEGGVTPGWQYAGGAPATLADDMTDTGYDDGDWKDVLFDDDSPRRVPGVLLFMLILCVVVYFMCGRERRASFFSKLSRVLPGGGNGKRRKGLGWLPGKLSGHTGPSYERVEDGAATLDFELADYDSDLEREVSRPYQSGANSATGSPKTGKTSGWATPQLVHPSASGSDTSPKRALGYGGSSSTNLHSLGLGSTQFGPGLMSRAESREKLSSGVPSAAGSVRGRDSPKRIWSPAPKESVD